MLDLGALSDDAVYNIISLFLKSKPGAAINLVDLCDDEPEPNAMEGRFRGVIKSWWPVYYTSSMASFFRIVVLGST